MHGYEKYAVSRYTALGDSLAVGIGAFGGCCYPKLYYDWLLNTKNCRHFCYCNLGVLGWTSKDLLNAITCNQCFRNTISTSSIITIDIGGNDILRHKYAPDMLTNALECYRLNLCALLKEIRCLNKHAPIYLMDIYNPYPIGNAMHDMAELWVTSFNTVIYNTLDSCEFNVSGVARVYDAFKGNECRCTHIRYNNVHPNALGYRIISDCYKVVTDLSSVPL